jgi:hypothetical protein
MFQYFSATKHTIYARNDGYTNAYRMVSSRFNVE